MATKNVGTQNPIITLGNARKMVSRGIKLAKKGLLKNPSKEERRDLNRVLLNLERDRATINAMITALINKEKEIVGPTAEQVAEISELTGEVGKVTNDNLTASGALALSSKVGTLATKIAG